MNFCTNCGNKLPEGSSFCNNCGTALTETQNEHLQPETTQPSQLSHDTQTTQEPIHQNNNSKLKLPNKKLLFILIPAAIVVIAIICVFVFVGGGPQKPDFRALYNDLSDNYGWTLGSDGSYLSVDTNVYDIDDYSNTSIMYSIKDMNKNLGLPDSLWNDMLNTTWSMGKQQETYKNIGITVSWTYHPDKGMEVTYKLINS